MFLLPNAIWNTLLCCVFYIWETRIVFNLCSSFSYFWSLILGASGVIYFLCFLVWLVCHVVMVVIYHELLFLIFLCENILLVILLTSFHDLDWNYIWNIGVEVGQFSSWKYFKLGWTGYSTGGNYLCLFHLTIPNTSVGVY